MKTPKSLFVVVALTAASATVSYSQALSPRAESNKTYTVAGKSEDLAHSPSVGSPRSQINQTRIVSKTDEVDTLASIRSSKLSPRAQQQLGTGPQFEVAALGKSQKSCEDSCCK